MRLGRSAWLTRRNVVLGAAALAASGAGLGGYAVAETQFTKVARHRVSPPGWPPGLMLRLAALADIHACDPWMGEARIAQIVDETNALKPDAVLLLGDYVRSYGMQRLSRNVAGAVWAGALARLKAPLGIHAVLGNHDWWEDVETQRRRLRFVPARRALEDAGIPVYENDAVRLEKDGAPFWICGLGDQWAYFWGRRRNATRRRFGFEGVDDLDGTLAKLTDAAPAILMAHEPDIFPHVPERVSLVVSGHTHGGQVRLFGHAPIVPSEYGDRYRYGHIVEDARHLVVSGGLGCSGLPIRFDAPPEIVVIELGGASS